LRHLPGLQCTGCALQTLVGFINAEMMDLHLE
jgi:hypothetical protein